MSINPGGNFGNVKYWNYTNPNKDYYTPMVEGVVVAIQEVQKHVYGQPGVGEFWPDGNPKMNIRITLGCEDGIFRMFEFQPANKAARMGQRRSIHMDLFNLSGGNMLNLIGKTISIWTQEGNYGVGNPRPFDCQLSEVQLPMPENVPEDLKAEKVLCNNAASGGQMIQPQPMSQQYAQPMQQGYQQMPQQYQQQPMQQGYQQYQQQPMQPQPQPYQQPMQQAPMGAQWQSMPTQQQPMQQGGFAQPMGGMVYDQDIPF